jgi:hypothetical protein
MCGTMSKVRNIVETDAICDRSVHEGSSLIPLDKFLTDATPDLCR